MANEAYVAIGTAIKINGEAGAAYAWSIEGVANGAGRVSAQINLGDDPRPGLYEWHCETQFQATPTQGAGLELYLAFAPDFDSTMRNLRYIGMVVSENAAASEICKASGLVEITSQYVSVVGYNASGASINATDSVSLFYLVPVAWQGQ